MGLMGPVATQDLLLTEMRQYTLQATSTSSQGTTNIDIGSHSRRLDKAQQPLPDQLPLDESEIRLRIERLDCILRINRQQSESGTGRPCAIAMRSFTLHMVAESRQSPHSTDPHRIAIPIAFSHDAMVRFEQVLLHHSIHRDHSKYTQNMTEAAIAAWLHSLLGDDTVLIV